MMWPLRVLDDEAQVVGMLWWQSKCGAMVVIKEWVMVVVKDWGDADGLMWTVLTVRVPMLRRGWLISMESV
jgi:hypothetical protein